MLLTNALWLVALGFITYARVSGVIVAGLTGAPDVSASCSLAYAQYAPQRKDRLMARFSTLDAQCR